jgi:dTDP-4-dehydrorhamnose reductase
MEYRKKYIILGAGGQLGKALCAMFPDAKALTHKELDISDEAQVNAFDWSKYDVIFKCGGIG